MLTRASGRTACGRVRSVGRRGGRVMRCGRRDEHLRTTDIQTLPPPAGLVALADNTWCSARWHRRRPCIGGRGIGRAQAGSRERAQAGCSRQGCGRSHFLGVSSAGEYLLVEYQAGRTGGRHGGAQGDVCGEACARRLWRYASSREYEWAARPSLCTLSSLVYAVGSGNQGQGCQSVRRPSRARHLTVLGGD